MPNRFERKVFTHLIGADARKLNSHLSHGGFRRSQNIAYRPACDGCTSCISVRVRTQEFEPSASHRRILRRNRDLESKVVQTKATSEQYAVFRAYIDSRHGEGGMADMSVLDFSAMVDDNFVDSRMIEYRDAGGKLVSAILTDTLDDGLSLIYSYFEPEEDHRSLGTFMILDQISRARQLGLAYAYLGYWVQGSRKMDYKGHFLPQEQLSADGWVLRLK